jgi:hypothetical protein
MQNTRKLLSRGSGAVGKDGKNMCSEAVEAAIEKTGE